MEYILPSFITDREYTIVNDVVRCNWVPSRTVRINNSEFYNVTGISIDPKHNEVRLHYSLTGPTTVPTEFLAFEVKLEYDNKNRALQIYT